MTLVVPKLWRAGIEHREGDEPPEARTGFNIYLLSARRWDWMGMDGYGLDGIGWVWTGWNWMGMD